MVVGKQGKSKILWGITEIDFFVGFSDYDYLPLAEASGK